MAGSKENTEPKRTREITIQLNISIKLWDKQH